MAPSMPRGFGTAPERASGGCRSRALSSRRPPATVAGPPSTPSQETRHAPHERPRWQSSSSRSSRRPPSRVRARAGPRSRRPRTVEKQIQQLTKELKKLEKQLREGPGGRTARPRRPSAPRRGEPPRTRRAAAPDGRGPSPLAGLLAERGRDARARARAAGRAQRAEGDPRRPRPAARRAAAPPSAAARAVGPGPAQWTGALRRPPRSRTASWPPGRGPGAPDPTRRRRDRQALGSRGDAAQARPEHAAAAGQHAGPSPAQAGSVEARLASLERAVRALVARERGVVAADPRRCAAAMLRSPQRSPLDAAGPRSGRRAGRPGCAGAARPHVGGPPGPAGTRGRSCARVPGQGLRRRPGAPGPRSARTGTALRGAVCCPAKNRTHAPGDRSAAPDGPPGRVRTPWRPDGTTRAMQRGRGHPDAACPFCGS